MVKVTKALDLLAKEKLKQKRAGKTLKILDECKLQNGSLKLNSNGLVNKLLGYTTGLDIRQMTRMKVGGV